MIIDKKGKILGKVSIIDIFIIGMFIFIISASFFKIGNKNNSISKKTELVYMKFYSEYLENFTVDKLKIGDKLSQDITDIPLGEIINIKKGESEKFNKNSEGILVKSNKEGYSSIEITTKLKAHKHNKTILINGNRFYIGKDIIIRAGNTKIFLKISDINFKNTKGIENGR